MAATNFWSYISRVLYITETHVIYLIQWIYGQGVHFWHKKQHLTYIFLIRFKMAAFIIKIVYIVF